MLGRMRGDRVAVENGAALPLDTVTEGSVRDKPDIGALATRDTRSASILLWNYHDDNVPGPAARVALTLAGLPSTGVTSAEYRVDGDHGNSYAAWLKMGSPATLTETQRSALERAAALEAVAPPPPLETRAGNTSMELTLPRQAVVLVVLRW
jgi:xylan 1,4-beta-xylosidase